MHTVHIFNIFYLSNPLSVIYFENNADANPTKCNACMVIIWQSIIQRKSM